MTDQVRRYEITAHLKADTPALMANLLRELAANWLWRGAGRMDEAHLEPGASRVVIERCDPALPGLPEFP